MCENDKQFIENTLYIPVDAQNLDSPEGPIFPLEMWAPDVVEEVLGLCAVPLGLELMNRCKPEKKDPKT